MSKRLITAMLTLIVVAALMPFEASAATKTVSMTAYNQVVKSGKTVYCAGAEGIYKVKVNSKGVVKSKKLLHVAKSFGPESFYHAMKKKGSYLYCRYYTTGAWEGLCRINTTTGKEKTLAESFDTQGAIKYAIKDKKIYYKYMGTKKKMVMKLNGTGKKKTSVTPKLSTKRSNAKGYSVIITEKNVNDYSTRYTTYLKTPAGKYKLGSHIN